MLDQMFTAESFREIYDLENRKGINLAGIFFPHLDDFTFSIKDKVQEIRSLRSRRRDISEADFITQESALKLSLIKIKFDKSAAIDLELEKISQNILASDFKIKLTQKDGPKGKALYCIDGSPETFFVLKQLQHNLYRIYQVKQANRYDLSCRIRDTLRSKYPFEIVRTDISAFYESINRKRLLQHIEEDQLLSPSSKKFIKQIFDEYKALSGSDQGIPRGTGVSAYLAELYLRAVDREISKLPGLILYCRYVDDITAVFARPVGEVSFSYKTEIFKIMEKSNLIPNLSKSNEMSLNSGGPKDFEFIGYKYTIENGKLQIALSNAKVEKIKGRIEASFRSYERTSSKNTKKAYRELVARVKFLTGNSRLVNSKSNATTGIYYNNSLITDLQDLDVLDKFLKGKILTLGSGTLKKRIKKYTFREGFENRRYHNLSSREFQTIVKAWKYGQA